MREITKTIKHEVDGKEMSFQIRKMDALHGTYLVKFATEKLLPLFAQLQGVFTPVDDKQDEKAVIENRTKQVLEIIPKALEKLTEDEVINLQRKCLRMVDVLLPAGWQPVMIGDNFGVQELEHDIMLALTLTYDVIEFNLGSFFQGNSLSSILQKFSSTK